MGPPPRHDDLGGHALSSAASRALYIALLVAVPFGAGCGGRVVYRDHGVPASFLTSPPEGVRPNESVAMTDDRSERLPRGLRLLRPSAAAPAPPFTFVEESGRVHTPASLRGHVTWIDIWADWCVTCVAEFPDLQRVHARRARSGLTLLAVARHSKRAGFERATRDEWIEFAVADATGDDAFPFPVAAFPTSVLIDRAGRTRAYWTGHRPIEAVEEALDRLLAETAVDGAAPPPSSPAPTLTGLASPSSPAGRPPPRASEGVIRASLRFPREWIPPGELVEGTLVLDADPGWHLLAPLDVAVVATGSGDAFDVLPPATAIRKVAGDSHPVYSGRIEIPVWGIVPSQTPRETRFPIVATATLRACDSTRCLRPSEIRLEAELWIDDPLEESR